MCVCVCVCMYVCVCVCVYIYIYIYCLVGIYFGLEIEEEASEVLHLEHSFICS